MSLPRPATRFGIVLAALAGLLTLGIGVASAHVGVSSPDASPGGYGKLVFRVPNESDTASTVKLRIQMPTDTPLASLRVKPLPGWTATVTRTQLDPPVKDADGQEITEAVSVVEFTADAGTGIRPGEFQEFELSGGPLPKADRLTFNAVQSYSDGTEVAWIEPSIEGRPEPEHPAPVLALSSSSSSGLGHGGGDTASTATASRGGSGGGTGTAALVVAIVAAVVGIGGVVLGWTARRRTVSS